MRVKLQLVICHEDGQKETVTDVITLNKNNQRIEHLGLSLAESKHLLGTLQRHLLQQQISSFLDTHATCPDCGTPLKLKAHGSRSFRTLFGTCKVSSPRFEHCDCKRRETASVRPLSALLTEPVAPELLYMEAKWSSLVSYGLSLDALKDFLPLDLSLDVKTVRYDTLKVAKRLEAELGEEQASCIEGEPSDWELLPPPEGSFTVGLDGAMCATGLTRSITSRSLLARVSGVLTSVKKRKRRPRSSALALCKLWIRRPSAVCMRFCSLKTCR
jgi:hypothetical protein